MVQKRFLFCVGLVLILVASKAAFAMDARDEGEREEGENQELVLEQELALEQERVVGPEKMFQEVLRMGREEYRRLFELTEVLSVRQTYRLSQAPIDKRPVWKGRGISVELLKHRPNLMQFIVCDGRDRVFIPIDTRKGFVSDFLSNPLCLQTIRTFSSIGRHLTSIHNYEEAVGIYNAKKYPEINEYPEIKELTSLLLKILADKVLHCRNVGSYDFERADVSFSDVAIACFDKED